MDYCSRSVAAELASNQHSSWRFVAYTRRDVLLHIRSIAGCFGRLFQKINHQRVLPKLAGVGLDSADDRQNDASDRQGDHHGNPDQNERECKADDEVKDRGEDEIYHHFAVRIDRWHFVLLNLPKHNWDDQSSHGGNVAREHRKMDQHAPSSLVHGNSSV